MGDVMLLGVLQMPYDMAMGGEIARRQYHSRGQEAARRIRDDAAALAEAQAEIARLRGALIAVKHSGSLIYAKMTARAALEDKHG